MKMINKIYLGDNKDLIKKLLDKSINLAIYDIPFSLNKADWDTYESIDIYLDIITNIFKETERVLKDNGSFYFFHNDIMVASKLLLWIEKNTDFKFKQMIVWNKRFEGSKKKGYLDGYIVEGGRRNYQKMCEYIFYFIIERNKQNPFVTIIKQKLQELNLKQSDLSKLFLSKNGNMTGCISNILNGDYLPTEDKWNIIKEKLKIEDNFNDLKYDYQSMCYCFNNQKLHHSVWNYDIAKRNLHETPKPFDLIENIIKHSSNENDLILDCYSGSGTVAICAKKLKRNFIAFEQNYEFWKYSNNLLNNMLF